MSSELVKLAEQLRDAAANTGRPAWGLEGAKVLETLSREERTGGFLPSRIPRKRIPPTPLPDDLTSKEVPNQFPHIPLGDANLFVRAVHSAAREGLTVNDVKRLSPGEITKRVHNLNLRRAELLKDAFRGKNRRPR